MYAKDTISYYCHKKNKKQQCAKTANVIQYWINDNCFILKLKKGKTNLVVYDSNKTMHGLTIETQCNRKLYWMLSIHGMCK